MSFANHTARSASDLLADLRASRQLRHVSGDDLQKIVHFFFGDDGNEGGYKKGGLPGVPGRWFVWTEEALEEAVSIHGVSCDLCGQVDEVDEDRWRKAAVRLLDNLDGRVKLCLCGACDQRFERFCSKTFNREVRVLYTTDLEKMMLAGIANELKTIARRVALGQPPKDFRRAQNKPRGYRSDRAANTAKPDDPRHSEGARHV